MKRLGEKSLSSAANLLLKIALFLVPVGALSLLFILSVLCFGEMVDDPSISPWAKFKYSLFQEAMTDDEAWSFMRHSPVIARYVMLSYIVVVSSLIFFIVKNAQSIFANFSANVVFDEKNVALIRRLTKLVIVFSLMTANFSSLILGVILFILSDIFQSGALLKEESDLTV